MMKPTFAAWARRLWPAVLLNLVFGASALAWIFTVPYDRAPDEDNHFRYSVKFILEHRRLPAYGIDDVDCFSRNASSYNKFPALNYVLAAAAADAGRRWAGLEWHTGARLMSGLMGLAFLNLVLAAVRRAGGRGAAAVLPAAVAVLIPQAIYVCSYVNADAYALAVSAGLAAATVNALAAAAAAPGHTPSWKAAWWFGAGIGLLLTAKLNYWVYLPWLALGALVLAGARRLSVRALWRLAAASIAMSLLLAGGWYARNYMLYGELMPAAPTTAWLSAIGVDKPAPRAVMAPHLSWPVLAELVRRNFFTETLAYFYGKFDYGTVSFDPQIYAVLKFLAPAAGALFVAAALATRDRPVRWAFFWLAGLAATNAVLLVLYAVLYDYQPAGRYLFPILAPAAVWMGWACARHPRLWKYALPLLFLHAGLLVMAHCLLLGAYR